MTSVILLFRLKTLTALDWLQGMTDQLEFEQYHLKEKKPDAVVWDETQESYIAKLLPYASSLSGPIIEVPNVDAFKKKMNKKQFQNDFYTHLLLN